MNATANTSPATSPAIVANAEVNKLLDLACGHAASADQKARDAAKLAFTSAGTAHGLSRGQLVNSLVATYNSHLNHKNVRDSFSAALAILAANVPVVVIGSDIAPSDKTGRLIVKAPEIAPAGTVAGDGKVARTLTAADQVDKLSADLLKRAATTAREELGTAKKGNPGGRPATVTVTQGTRAPFSEELAALIGNAEGREILAKSLRPILESADGMMNFGRMMHALGYVVTRIAAADGPTEPAPAKPAKGKK